MTTTLHDSVGSALSDGLDVRPFGEDELVRLPLAFSDGHMVQVLASQIGEDAWTLTDRGQTASVLLDHGVDLSRPQASRSWRSLLEAVSLPPALDGGGDFVLSMSSDSATLGTDVLRLGEAMLLAEGLRELRKPERSQPLRARIITLAREADLGVLPNAPMPTRFGSSRQVSAKITSDHATLYTQGVGKGSGQSYDHARALFVDSRVPEGQRLSVIGGDARLEGWQREALGTVSSLVSEQDLAGYFADFAA